MSGVRHFDFGAVGRAEKQLAGLREEIAAAERRLLELREEGARALDISNALTRQIIDQRRMLAPPGAVWWRVG